MNSRALGVALGAAQVSVARALVLVAVGPRGHALAFGAADPAIFEAPVHHPRPRAPRIAVLAAVLPHCMSIYLYIIYIFLF